MAQEVMESLILHLYHSRTSFAARTQIVSFSRYLYSSRDARVDKPIPKERLQAKFKYVCIEQYQKYLYSVVVAKTGRKSNCREIINDRPSQRNFGI